MKKLIIPVLMLVSCLTSCSTSRPNKIAVQFNKYGPVHQVKYTEKDGKYYVNGREVKLLPGTKVYAGN